MRSGLRTLDSELSTVDSQQGLSALPLRTTPLASMLKRGVAMSFRGARGDEESAVFLESCEKQIPLGVYSERKQIPRSGLWSPVDSTGVPRPDFALHHRVQGFARNDRRGARNDNQKHFLNKLPRLAKNAPVSPLESAVRTFSNLKYPGISTYARIGEGEGGGEASPATPLRRRLHFWHPLCPAPCHTASGLSPLPAVSSALFALFHTCMAPSNSCLVNRLRTLSHHSGGGYPFQRIKVNKKTPNSWQRFLSLSASHATGRRCRLRVPVLPSVTGLHLDAPSRLCFRHAYLQQEKRDVTDLAPDLLGELLRFQSASDINECYEPCLTSTG